MDLTIAQIQEKIVPILRDYGVIRSSLFGSYARRTDLHPNSDIDLLVELPEEKTLLDFVNLQQDLEAILKKPIDLVEYSTIKPSLRRSILDNQISLL